MHGGCVQEEEKEDTWREPLRVPHSLCPTGPSTRARAGPTCVGAESREFDDISVRSKGALNCEINVKAQGVRELEGSPDLVAELLDLLLATQLHFHALDLVIHPHGQGGKVCEGLISLLERQVLPIRKGSLAPAACYLVQRARIPQLPVSDAGVVGDHAVTAAVLLEVLAPDAALQADPACVLFNPLLAKASASTAIPAAASVLR